MLELSVLVDNNTLIDRYFQGEPGVSYHLRNGGTSVLFDVGYSDLFIRNAEKMGIRLLDIDSVVLSHGHLDHTWGLYHLIKLYTEARMEKVKCDNPTLVAHPSVFLTRTVDGIPEIGSLISEDKLFCHFNMRLSREPMWLTDNLVFLGEIERTNNFETMDPIGKILRDGTEEDDYVIDDSALVYTSPKGLTIVTGCSHAGICNIIEYAQKVCDDDRVVDIIGGFHLLAPSYEQLRGTYEYLKELQPETVHAAHCTDLNSKIMLSQVVDLIDVGVGLRLVYE
ncbi:MAG: 7, 8-dihydropterin-6-methyl-4-(beta-D-ribofuranosyl)- aminobenzene-5'-phosphate synthase [Candidatus Methanogaster sp.]|nr:MAG: 7, 8-dihydropterin-6-methyl-4-(beta-D-ribofuranosyl)- aminobenzene-5'-phosphate synthase [ANME-2 cluster archaeon]